MSANVSAMTWWQYVETHAAGETQERIARRVDVSTPTVGRWRNSAPRPETVAAFARAYGRPVLEAFVAAGFLTADEAGAQVTTHRLEEPSDEQLLSLLARRLRQAREDVMGNAQHPASIASEESDGERPGEGLAQVAPIGRRQSAPPPTVLDGGPDEQHDDLHVAANDVQTFDEESEAHQVEP